MRHVFWTLAMGAACGALGWAQPSTTTRYISDINGNRVATSTVDTSDHVSTERRESINGRSVPLEQVQERVIRDDASGKTVERTVRKFNPTGDAYITERSVVEEQKTATGSTLRETTWRSDINGTLREDQRRTTETRVRAGSTSSETVIARPNINGGFDTTEKRSAVTSGTDASQQTDEIVYRPGQNGGMVPSLRQVTVSSKLGEQTTAHTSYYEPGVTGALDLARQSVSTTTKLPSGGELVEVNVYARAVDGRLQEPGAPQQIKEQQIVERRKNADGSVTETLSVRRPSLADPTQLGGVQKVSETVCSGKCD